MPVNKKEFIRFVKFLVVGIINTFVTYIVFVLIRLFGATPELSNAMGYLAGVINSFLWNKKWVFQTKGTNVYKEMAAFFAVFVVCYYVQFVAFRFMLYEMKWNEYIAQLIGMLVYTMLSFILNKFFSFKNNGCEDDR